jgi:hypothetical protein
LIGRRQKEREIDQLSAKLAPGSPLLDTEVYHYLQHVHQRLKMQEDDTGIARFGGTLVNPLQQAFTETKNLEPRSRGKAFERLLGLMFAREGIRHVLAYRPSGEEIDGAFWWNTRTFLLEAKWHKDPIPASAIYAFKGKVDGKFSGTRGVFISMSGYSEDCVEALVHGKDLNILLFDEDDVKAIIGNDHIEGEKFTTVLTEKLFAAGQTGNVYLPWYDLQRVRRSTEELSPKPLFIYCEGPADELILRSLLDYAHLHDHLALDSVRIIPLNGQMSLVPSLIQLTTTSVSGSGAILIVLDADTMDETKIHKKRQLFLDAQRDLPNSWKYHVAIAVPYLEAWIGLTAGTLRGAPRQTQLQRTLATVDWSAQGAQIQEIESTSDFLRQVLPRQ